MKNHDIIIDKMIEADIDEIVEIENLCFTIPWARFSFLNELMSNKFAHYHVIRFNSRIIGYLGLWKVIDEGHITNIAIHPDYRRIGMASKLLEYILKFSLDQNIASLTLEVRKSNTAAQELYKKYGFTEAGVRKSYYSDNNEDAIIMWNTNINALN